MALNDGSLNSHVLNGAAEEILLGAGLLISIEQEITIQGSGELIAFEQDVQLRLSSSAAASFISIEQEVETTYSGQVIGIEQFVRDTSIPDHLTRHGWDLTITLNGYQIPADEIVGPVNINRTENDAALADFAIMPPIGVQDIDYYLGKSVTIDAHTSSGTTRIFTGIVDIPRVDLLEEKIVLMCTDKRTEQLNSQLGSVVGSIGVYSDIIFKEPEDVAEEVEQRLTTTPYALDFDAYGNYTITSWYAKTTPDFTLTNSDIYYDRPVVEFTSRGRVTNKVNINLQYRYERFFHQTRNFEWESPVKADICKILEDGYSLTFKSAVLSAIESAGWPLKGSVSFDEIHESGWYRCSGFWVPWSTIILSGVNEPTLDESGNQVSDSGGNELYQFKVTGATNYADLYCMGATWTATTRWTQNVTEEYTLTVQSPQSISQFGTIEKDYNYSAQSETDVADWENYTRYDTQYSNDLNYYIDRDVDRGNFSRAIDVALRQAKNTILESHRDTRVIFDTFLWPEVDLKHTVYVNTSPVQAKGKVFNIKHVLDISTGEAYTTTTLVLFRSTGSGSDSSLSIPSKPSDNISWNTNLIRLGNHFGQDPTTEAAKSWTGMVGNKWIYGTSNWYRTSYQEQFIVDTPAIPDNVRNAKSLAANASYNVSIPSDTLVITFDGKH